MRRLPYHIAVSVYIELVIFNNLCVDLLLELCTLAALRARARKLRCALAAIVGSAVATIYPLVPIIWQIVIRALLAPLLTLIFYRPRQGKLIARLVDLLKALAVFCALTFLVGGVTQGLSYLLGVDVNSYAVLGLVAAGLCVCVAVARSVAMRRSAAKTASKRVKLCVDGEKLACKALCDSGNLLVDPLTGLPVVIVSRALRERLKCCGKEGYIEVCTVNGTSELPLLKIDGVEVDGRELAALAALSDSDLEGGDVILQASMF